MKAMILAAGMGSRLSPLTEETPKALIEIQGVPILEITIKRLIRAGAGEIIVNVFHQAGKIESFLKSRDFFGIRMELSREDELLDTGGGLKKASSFFDDGKPFIVHNADVLSEIDLEGMMRFHLESPALATLAVQPRETSRYYLFGKDGRLLGWESLPLGRKEWAGAPDPEAQRLAFCGIHVLSPGIFSKMSETGVFSINETYLRLAKEGERIQAFRADDLYWADIGDLKKLEAVRERFKSRPLPI